MKKDIIAPNFVEIIYLFDKNYQNDTDGDYDAVVVLIDNKEVARYCDEYHDKGAHKAEAFVDGFFSARDMKPSKIKFSNKLVKDLNNWRKDNEKTP